MMTRHRMTNWIGMICAAVVLFGFVKTAAALTPAGTPISNTASVTYNVNSHPQGQINSLPVVFTVDNKVDLLVTCDLAIRNVTPGGSGYVLPFTIVNEGNDDQAYRVSVEKSGDISITDYSIYYDKDGDGALNTSVDSIYTLGTRVGGVNIAPGGNIKVLVVANCPSRTDGALDGEMDTFHLVATTLDAGTTTDTSATALDAIDVTGTTEEIVFADSAGSFTSDTARNGQHSDSGQYQVVTATLNITKEAVVTAYPDDPNGVIADGTEVLKAIPGATVTYTITVVNTGSATASSIVISDSLETEITAGTLAFVEGSIAVTAPAAVTPVSSWLSPVVSVSDITLNPGETATITFEVTIL